MTSVAALIGHDEALRQIAEAYAGKRMHHAWLLTGIEGIGKAALALRMADHVLSGGGNKLGGLTANNQTTRLILAEAHPDLLIVRRPVDERTGAVKNIIPVDEALKVAQFLHKTSTHGGWRVVVIEDAHRLNRSGQNAILKIVEEPPARTLIVMTATTPGALLPTIRSRCRVLPLAPLTDAAMKAVLTSATPKLDEAELPELLRLSGGSPGFALKLIESGALPLFGELKVLLSELPKLDLHRAHKLADQVSRKSEAESYEVLTALLLEYLRQEAAKLALSGVQDARLGAGLARWDKARATLEAAERGNLDHKLALVNALSDIRGAMA